MQETLKSSTALGTRSQSYPPDHTAARHKPEIPSPWNGPEWDDPDRWVLGCWLPPSATLIPPGGRIAIVVLPDDAWEPH
jgi:hypothetical protein